MVFVIKTEVRDLDAETFAFPAQKTMYGGKWIVPGDAIFLIASENSGGTGLFARGVVEAVERVAKNPDLDRQTPRVSIRVGRTQRARKSLGRADLKAFSDWRNGRPETELNFKLYRQATDKIVAIAEPTVRFLESFF